MHFSQAFESCIRDKFLLGSGFFEREDIAWATYECNQSRQTAMLASLTAMIGIVNLLRILRVRRGLKLRRISKRVKSLESACGSE